MAKTKKSAKGGEPAARPKANTKAKVTKPAPAAPTRVSERAKKAAEQKPAAIVAAAEKLAAEKRAAKKPAPKKPAAKTPAKTAGRKRKASDDEDPSAPAKKARVSKAAPKMPAKSTTKKAAAKKPAAKKPAAKKPAAKKPAATTGRKRKASDDVDSPVPAKKARVSKAVPKTPEKSTTKKPAAKKRAPRKPAAPKVKLLKKGPVINEPPTQILKVFVWGTGEGGELGLGSTETSKMSLFPVVNTNLSPETVGVVQIAVGGMHTLALTHDNQILSWGINDEGTLGRDSSWSGGMKDMNKDGDEYEDDADGRGINPNESTPAPVDWSKTELAPGTRFVQVTAGDSSSWVLTDDGKVYGWGTFRKGSGDFGFSKELPKAWRPVLMPGLKNIVSIEAGAQHVVAMEKKGLVFSWGCGEQCATGRTIVERTELNALTPQQFGLPRGAKNHIVAIATGQYHSHAISKNGDVYGWGMNNKCQTGICTGRDHEEPAIGKPQVIKALKGKDVVSIKGGMHHSLAATADGDCYAWGRADFHQVGISNGDIAQLPDDVVVRTPYGPAYISAPQKITAFNGAVKLVSSQCDYSLAITEDGKAWAMGYSSLGQLGQGEDVDDVDEVSLIKGKFIRGIKMNGAQAGGQFAILTAPADDPAPAAVAAPADAEVPTVNGA